LGLGNNQSSVDGTSFTTASTTPADTTSPIITVIVSLCAAGNIGDPTVTGTNGMNTTYTKVATIDRGTTCRVTVWVCYPASTTAGTQTFSFGATQTACQWFRYYATGTYAGATAADCFEGTNWKTGSGTVGGGMSITLDAASNSANRPLAIWTIGNNDNMTARTNWTELADQTVTVPTNETEMQWRSGAFETTASTTAPGSGGSVAWVGVACEIRDSTYTPPVTQQVVTIINTMIAG
jgi:hypothetical protein